MKDNKKNKKKYEVLAIIPARGGSKSIPRKNLIYLAGKPLIKYTVDAVKKSKLVTRIILTCDNDEIIDYCKDQGIEIPFKRPSKLAQDTSSTISAIKHAVKFLEKNESYIPDYIMILQPTSPLRTAQHIDESLIKLINSNADSIVSIIKVPHQFNPYSVMKLKDKYLIPFLSYDENKNNRKLKPIFYGRNGAAIYVFSYNCLIKKNSIYGDRILPYFMKKEESIDIDDELDLKFAEVILKDCKRI